MEMVDFLYENQKHGQSIYLNCTNDTSATSATRKFYIVSNR
jgi:hypothetical protein